MNDSRKKMTISIIALMLLVFMIIGASVAYFIGQIGTGATADINASTGTTDSLMFKVGDPINILANMSNFKEGEGNVNSTTYANATLIANNGTNQASYNYNLYLDIIYNDLVYTTSDKKPELLLKITTKDNSEDTTEEGAEITTGITGLEYKTITTTSGTYSGFDITEKKGTVEIALNHEIATTSRKTNNWEIEVIFVNLDSDQQLNTEKVFRSELRIGTEEVEEKELLADHIKRLYTSQGTNNLYLHDSTLENGAGDGSLRYAGADPNNYVCFGSDVTPCPADNLYRIIGVFGNQVKLIKDDYAISDLLGTDGDYACSVADYDLDDATLASFGYNGIHNVNTLATYYWNASTTNGGTDNNNWNESRLNTINLNTNYLNNIGNTWSEKIADTTWYVGGVGDENALVNAQSFYNYELGTNGDKITTYQAKVGLIYLSEYYYGASPTYWTLPGYASDGNDYRKSIAENWVFKGFADWTITRKSAYSDCAFRVYLGGGVNGNGSVAGDGGVRPSFSLKSSITYVDGSGSKTDPMIIG